ncbi:MAG: TonB-dependent receptor [Steroidobacteraceae bacterium]|jgi:iron complex outermembrane receptor protein|nr:TonB-dependent receptor [Steroidobacteraceae bacterium]
MPHLAPGAAALAPRSRSTVAYSLIAAAVAAALGAPAFAQSVGTVATEEDLAEVVVSARRDNILGTMTDLNATKTRVAITAEYLETQMAGQSVIQNLNQLPGVNFTNNDPYGSSGGNLRLRGFEGSRVNVTFDGLPLNDTGNYALFTNQLLDPELIDRVEVNLGTTDVDSPTASATGGTISFRSVTPREEMGGMVVASGGENSFRRLLAKFDTGAFGPWGTRAWLAASTTSYEKFRGPGELDKRQFNAFLRQDVGDNGSFINVGVHWNRNRNAFFRQATAATFRQFGLGFDNLATCTRDLPTAGVADNDGATPVAGTAALPANDNLANPSSCTNYFGLRINPSDTGNIRVQSLWNLRDNLRFTFEPSIQYTLANGGGTTVLRETPLATDADRRVVGATSLAGLDLNGDGDILDQVRFYTPNITHTQRWGLNSSLIWDINDQNRVRFAYTLDYGKHRQSAAWGNIDNFGNPVNVFAGRLGPKVATADGSFLRGRDRYSIASMNQLSAEWRGQYLDDKLVATVGVRAPQFERELNQNCFTQNGGTGNSGQVLCTTQPVTRTLANGNVQFSGSTVEYIPPYSETIDFDDVLPNLGVTYRLTDSQTVYASYAEGLSAPRTDNLYPVRRLANGTIGRGIPESELTKAYDIGWRWNSGDVLASVALWRVDYDNRIVSSFDADLGFSVDRNLGRVDLQGIDMQAGWRVAEFLTLSGAASYNESEVKQNVPLTATTFLATQGKQLVETPDWTYSLRADFRFGQGFAAGIQGKYVGERAATDINDEFAPSYTVVDLDVGYTVEVSDGMNLEAQLNVLNLLDEEYFGSIASGTGLTLNNPAQYQIGAPRTAMLSLKLTF